MAQCIWHLAKTDDLKSLPFFDLILSITKTINHKNKNPSCDFNWRIFCVYFEKTGKWYLYKNQIYKYIKIKTLNRHLPFKWHLMMSTQCHHECLFHVL